MARGKPLEVVGFMTYEDGRVVPFESISEQERIEWNKKVIKRLEAVMPGVYQNYPEALASLTEVSKERKEAYYKLFPEKRDRRANRTAEST